MDPEARRHMWNVIQQVSSNRTVVLVSHLMEEIEALCTRVGVMVSGRLQCLGSVQHLKHKFGGGYEVEVRCHVDHVDECLELCKRNLVPVHTDKQVLSKMEEENEEVELEEQHGGFFKVRVAKNIDLARAFQFFEVNKSALHIYDYSISQFTLEQVFIKFAREQEEEVHHNGKPVVEVLA
jgi:ABC-type multidrug transport system ATPase subunit